MIPIRFVVGIAEIGIGNARVEDKREVDHLAGIASIERSVEKRLVGGESCGVDPDAERQRQHRHCGETGALAQLPHRIPQILPKIAHHASYSYLKATMGSVFIARRAGM